MIVRPIVCRRLVGRDGDLAYLHERRRDAGASRGGMVLVSGEAGVGKSRLLAEFRETLAPSRMRVAAGYCLEFAQQPYGPIRDILTRLRGVDTALEPALSKREQFAAMADALVTEARTTLVLIVEDLHWADGATLEFLTYLVSRVTSQRILIVGSFRSDALHGEHPAIDGIAKLAKAAGGGQIELAPLTGPQLRLFIDEALAGYDLPAEVLRSVAQASDGIPFYVEELLRSAVDRGPGSTHAALLPTTFRAALLERLRPFDQPERRVLAQAAVIGRRFDVTLLADTLGAAVETLLPTLRRARDVQLIEEETAEVFRFRHALTREAIYADFLAAEVRALHREIALVIEALPPERRSIESLAYHWWAAREPAKAAEYNERAADAAALVYAHDDAIAAFERALESIDDRSPERARILEKIAQHQVITGYNDRALAAYAQAAAIFFEIGSPEREAECRVRAAVQDYRLGGSDPTGPLDAMLERLAPDEHAARSRLHLGIAHVASLRFRADEANRHLDAVDLAAIERSADLRYSYYATRAMVCFFVADLDRFAAAHDAWLAASRETSDTGLTPLVHYNGGLLYTILGRHDEARHNFDLAIELAHARRDRMNESAAHAMSAMTRFLTGDLHGARDAVDRARSLPTDSAVALWHRAAWGSLAALALDDERLLAQSFDELETRVTPAGAAIYAAGFADILMKRGRHAEARELLHRAIDYGERPRGIFMTLLAAARLGDEADLVRARTNLERAAEGGAEVVERHAIALFDAYVAQRRGDDEAAARHAAASVEGFRRLRYPLLEAAALEIAGDREAALEIFARAGAVRDVRRLTPRTPAPDDVRADRRDDGLSSREIAVATLVARGYSNQEIGRELAISHKTVEKHLGSVYQKLGFSSRPQLAAYVSGNGTRRTLDGSH